MKVLIGIVKKINNTPNGQAETFWEFKAVETRGGKVYTYFGGALKNPNNRRVRMAGLDLEYARKNGYFYMKEVENYGVNVDYELHNLYTVLLVDGDKHYVINGKGKRFIMTKEELLSSRYKYKNRFTNVQFLYPSNSFVVTDLKVRF